MKLWVDDERPMPWTDGMKDINRIHAKTSAEAIEWLEAWRRNNGERGRPLNFMIDEVSLDHDLGGDDTGFLVLNWMIANDIWPAELTIHTSNPPARKQMLAAANAEAPEWVKISVIYDHLNKEDSEMSTLDQLQTEKEELEARLADVDRAIRKLAGPKIGKLPNRRAGFYHIHSTSYECGMAYWENANDYDYPNKGEYKKCSKLVNHEGQCGYEDNSAF